MENRQPTKPNRIKLTDDNGNTQYYYMERADEPIAEGTPLNKATLFDSVNETRYACELPSEALALLTKEWQVNVLADSWSEAVNGEGYYTQTVAVDGMKEVFQPNFMPLYGLADGIDAVDTAFAVVKRMITNDGSVTFLAIDIPANDMAIRILGV